MKTFGIFLAFPPEVDLRAEGLGRYLGEFLNEAKERPDARFAIACPSWMKKSLYDLFERVGIPQTAFEVISPKDRPIILRLYEAYRIYARRKRRRYFPQLVDYLINQKIQLISRAERTMATTRSLLLFVVLILLAAPFVAVAYAVRQPRAAGLDLCSFRASAHLALGIRRDNASCRQTSFGAAKQSSDVASLSFHGGGRSETALRSDQFTKGNRCLVHPRPPSGRNSTRSRHRG